MRSIAAAILCASAASLAACSRPAPSEAVVDAGTREGAPDARSAPSGPFQLANADAPPQAAAPAKPFSAREAVGREAFFDESLSNPPGTSCASCHDPARAFSGNHGSTVGVALGSRPGHYARRNTPSVLYVKYIPAFHFALEDDDDTVQSPFGGFGWGGRADSVREFSRLPLFDRDEMNNTNDDALATKARAAPYWETLAKEFPGATGTSTATVDALGEALEAFLSSDAMAPFSSKYDDFLRHTTTLTSLEMRGLKVFKDPDKGACDACHRFEDSSNRPWRSLFTDYSYDALAAPRNRAIPANADPHTFDLGLCERKGKTIASSAPNWCTQFRTPSLRNVAVRDRFLHNGTFTKLRDVVAFYATRSTNPDRWYPKGAKFDDVPAKYRANVNVTSLPYNRREGVPPAYDDDDVDAIVAFLETLTDAPYRSLLAAK